MEAWRHDAKDGVGLPVEYDRLPHDASITPKFALPQRVGEDHHAIRAQPVLLGGESPTQQRRDPEYVEDLCRKRISIQGFRLTRAGKTLLYIVGSSDLGKKVGTLSPILEVGWSDRHDLVPRVMGVTRPEGDQPVRVRERKWLQKDCLDDAEDRRVRADPQRQGH